MATLREKSTLTINSAIAKSENVFLPTNYQEPSACFNRNYQISSANSEQSFVKNEADADYSDNIDISHSSLNNSSETEEEEEQRFDTKIELEEHWLKEEAITDFENTRTNARPENRTRAFFQKFFRSLNSSCDVCDASTVQRVIRLNRQEQFAATVVLRKSLSLGLRTKRIFARKIPKQSCGSCFTKIVLFSTRLKEKQLQRQTKQDPMMAPADFHGHECQCQHCQSRYGLHLLLRGIETLSSESLQASQAQAQARSQNQNWPNIDELGSMPNPPDTQADALLSELQPVNPQLMFPQELNIQSTLADIPSSVVSSDMATFSNTSSGAGISFIPPTQSSSHSHDIHSQMTFQSYPSGTTERGPLDFDESNSSRQYQRLSEEYLGSQSGYQSCPSGQIEQDSYSIFSRSMSEYHYSSSETTSREFHLPITLQDFEGPSQVDPSQPSTSSGTVPARRPSEEPRSTSTGPKKVCSHCQKQFSHTGDYRKHLRTHTREKPYSCKQCEKSFSHTSNLHRHERSHKGDRPFKCEFCGKEFNRKDKLESHKKCKSCKSKRSEERK